MGVIRTGRFGVPSILICAAVVGACAPALYAQSAAERRLVNAWEVHDEIRPAAGTEAAVKDTFPSFLEY